LKTEIHSLKEKKGSSQPQQQHHSASQQDQHRQPALRNLDTTNDKSDYVLYDFDPTQADKYSVDSSNGPPTDGGDGGNDHQKNGGGGDNNSLNTDSYTEISLPDMSNHNNNNNNHQQQQPQQKQKQDKRQSLQLLLSPNDESPKLTEMDSSEDFIHINDKYVLVKQVKKLFLVFF
jgi:hypothetical protein